MRRDGVYRPVRRSLDRDALNELSQRSPRVRDDGYLAFIRKLPCACCDAAPPCEAAHIRSGNLLFEKPPTGMAEKPSDKWAVPLTRSCHRRQHSMNEMEFWRQNGRNPYMIATVLYRRYLAEGGRGPTKRKPKKIAPRKPRGKRAKITSPGFSKGRKRKIQSRKFS